MSWNYYDEVTPEHPHHDPLAQVAHLLIGVTNVMGRLVQTAFRAHDVDDRITAAAVATLEDVEWQLEHIIDTAPHYRQDTTLGWRANGIAAQLRDELAQLVGGLEQLASLHADPLPDEPFDWALVGDDVRVRVERVLALCDGCADSLLDVEHRTAIRRLLARVARYGEGALNAKTSDERIAAALCWVVAHSNNTLAPQGSLRTGDLLAYFGIRGTVSDRANALLRPAGLAIGWGKPQLVWPRYLVSRRRQDILDRRDAL